MAYIKINWTEDVPLNQANLTHMETQYDEMMASILPLRSDPSREIRAHVVTSFPAHAVGAVVYHTGQDRFYYSTGTTWVVLAETGDGEV